VLVDIFERIESSFLPLETYAATSATAAITDTIGKIMIEVLSILAMATKGIKQGRMSKLALNIHRL
jgi:hypothetical protein